MFLIKILNKIYFHTLIFCDIMIAFSQQYDSLIFNIRVNEGKNYYHYLLGVVFFLFVRSIDFVFVLRQKTFSLHPSIMTITKVQSLDSAIFLFLEWVQNGGRLSNLSITIKILPYGLKF